MIRKETEAESGRVEVSKQNLPTTEMREKERQGLRKQRGSS